MFKERECVECGSEFIPKREKSVACTKKCKKSLEYKRTKEKSKLNCKVCGKSFKSAKKAALYCSQTCSNKARANDDVRKECEQCEKQFVVPYIKRDRRFCSKSCSSSNTNEKRDGEAVNKKISDTKKRQYASGEVAHPFTGVSLTEEHKKAISDSRIKRGSAAGSKNPMFGKHHTVETCEKISKTRAKRIVNGEYDGCWKKGEYFSERMQKNIVYRSSWEEKVFQHLENDAGVQSYDVEPFFIEYRSLFGNRSYIPDVLITYRDGVRKLVEIKPSYFVDKQINRDKFKAAREHCKERGIIFEVWTEKEIGNYLSKEVSDAKEIQRR